LLLLYKMSGISYRINGIHKKKWGRFLFYLVG
jgi:hypothetical protein